jgi:hypothetical protein
MTQNDNETKLNYNIIPASILTLGIMTHNKTTFSRMTLRITPCNIQRSIHTSLSIQHKCYAEFFNSAFLLNVVMQNVISTSVMAPLRRMQRPNNSVIEIQESVIESNDRISFDDAL